MNGSLETPLCGDPNAKHCDQWEALKCKNKQAYFCASWVPIISSDPYRPCQSVWVCGLYQNLCALSVSSERSERVVRVMLS